MPRNKRIELEVLEELLLDQVEYRIRAVLLLLNIDRSRSKELFGLIDRFSQLTTENVTLLRK